MTVAWGQPYFDQFVPDAARRLLPHDRRAGKPVLIDAERFPSDPGDTRLEQNHVAFLLRSDSRDHIEDAEKRIRGTKLFQVTSIRRGFAGGGFEGGQSLPKQMAQAAQIPGADLIPDTAELFLGFTSTQRAGMGPGAIANFETLGYVDFRGSDYFRQGTHMHLSHIHEDVEAWYLNFDFDERVSTAFKPNLDVQAGNPDGPAGAARRLDRGRREPRLPALGPHRSQRGDPDDLTAARQPRCRGRDGLRERGGDSGARRLQHARQPVRVVGALRRDRRPAGSGRALRRLQPDRRRLPPEPARDGRLTCRMGRSPSSRATATRASTRCSRRPTGRTSSCRRGGTAASRSARSSASLSRRTRARRRTTRRARSSAPPLPRAARRRQRRRRAAPPSGRTRRPRRGRPP